MTAFDFTAIILFETKKKPDKVLKINGSCACDIFLRTFHLCSPRRLRKQQQVRSPQQPGPECVLRRGGERLSEPTVLWSPAPLHHPRPGQLWTGGHHCHQAAEVHVLLLPLLSTRGEWNGFCSAYRCIFHVAICSGAYRKRL